MVQGGGREERGTGEKYVPCHVPYQAMEMKMEMEMKTVSSGMKGTVGRKIHRVRIVAWKTVERRTFLSLFSV